jgi:hypothetical protein
MLAENKSKAKFPKIMHIIIVTLLMILLLPSTSQAIDCYFGRDPVPLTYPKNECYEDGGSLKPYKNTKRQQTQVVAQTRTKYPASYSVKTQTLTASHRYLMGDNDSRNDARQVCFLIAKRKLLEKAGVYIESNTSVSSGRLKRDEVTAFAAAILKVNTVDTKWTMVGESMAVTIKVKAKVDTGRVEQQMKKIFANKSSMKAIKKQQQQLRNLEYQVNKLQTRLANADNKQVVRLRKQRNVTFKDIDNLEERKISIVSNIRTTSKNVKQMIEIGMTKNEVKSLVGKPRTKSTYKKKWNYGKVWVMFDNGIVGCLVSSSPRCQASASTCSMLSNPVYSRIIPEWCMIK